MLHGNMRVLFLAVLALPLGACSSFLGINLARHTPKAERPQPVEAIAAAETEAGRKQLAEGQTGLAVESFQRALARGEPQAPAMNGLGVAYARLGRDDVAQRMFQDAMTADPGNPRYADNLTRLMRSPSFAQRSAAEILAEARKEGAAFAEQARAEARARAAEKPVQAGQLQRISRAEVRITSAPPAPAPLQSFAKLDTRFKPQVRIMLAPREPETFKPLVRIELPEPKAAGAAPGAKR